MCLNTISLLWLSMIVYNIKPLYSLLTCDGHFRSEHEHKQWPICGELIEDNSW